MPKKISCAQIYGKEKMKKFKEIICNQLNPLVLYMKKK